MAEWVKSTFFYVVLARLVRLVCIFTFSVTKFHLTFNLIEFLEETLRLNRMKHVLIMKLVISFIRWTQLTNLLNLLICKKHVQNTDCFVDIGNWKRILMFCFCVKFIWNASSLSWIQHNLEKRENDWVYKSVGWVKIEFCLIKRRLFDFFVRIARNRK